MDHSAKALVLHCIDYRFVNATKEFLAKEGYAGQYDDVGMAGSVDNIVEPSDTSDVEFVYRQIAIARKLHHITDVVLINHTDCGAYGGREAFLSDEEEHARHVKDLRLAKEKVAERFSEEGFTITLVIAILQNGRQREVREGVMGRTPLSRPIAMFFA